MQALKRYDAEAEFRFFGGDNMSAVGGTRVRHYKELAYMGFLPVLLHLPTIMRNMSLCKRDIMEWQPDVVIPVDYAGFNLSICKFLQEQRENQGKAVGQLNNDSTGTGNNSGTGNGNDIIPKVPHTFYYIAPKLWAWKEYRIKNFKRDVEQMFCILPFETDFFEKKHHYPVNYVGNPTADEVRAFLASYSESHEDFCQHHHLSNDKPIIALLPGSRRQEIKDNLATMLEVARQHPGYQYIIAQAPSMPDEMYAPLLATANDIDIHLLPSATYPLLANATAALVTSGTATLETALFRVPQVVCYKTPLPRLFRWGFNHVIKCKYISLVNLIADKEVVPELFADKFSVSNISRSLADILPSGSQREQMLRDYDIVHQRLGDTSAPDNAARIMTNLLSN